MIDAVVEELRFFQRIVVHGLDAAVLFNPIHHFTNHINAIEQSKIEDEHLEIVNDALIVATYMNVGGVLYSELAAKFSLKLRMAGVIGNA